MPIPPNADQDVVSAELRSRFAAVEQAVAESRKTVATASNLDDFDRSIIARMILLVYAGVIAAGFILFAIRGWHAQPGEWPDIVKDATDLIKTVVLPIVTLVLGYYFGKSGKV